MPKLINSESVKSLVILWDRSEDGVRRNCRLRFKSLSGDYYWLDPVEWEWKLVDRSDDIPAFNSYEDAKDAYIMTKNLAGLRIQFA